jgi:pyrimidine deaminase RibD-like protein
VAVFFDITANFCTFAYFFLKIFSGGHPPKCVESVMNKRIAKKILKNKDREITVEKGGKEVAKKSYHLAQIKKAETVMRRYEKNQPK